MDRSRVGPCQESVWDYPRPPRLERTERRKRVVDLEDCVAFYPSKMDACWVDGEKVQAQPGDYYGGWIPPGIVGPFKGGPGTWGW